MDAEWSGERITVSTCPVKLITPDVMDLFRAYNLADGKLSLTEQDGLPCPYMDAWETVAANLSASQVWRAKREKK